MRSGASRTETGRAHVGGLSVFLMAPVLLAFAVVLLLTAGQPLLSPLDSLLKLDTQEGLWFVTRAAGLMAYLMVWLSTVWGLAVASKIFDPVLHRAFTFDVHEWLSLLALGFIILHLGVLLADQYLPFSLPQILIPFLAPYRPFWVGLGVIGLYLTLLVTATFYLRSRIGQKTFRSIHLASFLAYAAVTLHSIFSGTDTQLASTQFIYVLSALVTVALTVLWYLRTRMNRPPAAAARPAQAH